MARLLSHPFIILHHIRRPPLFERPERSLTRLALVVAAGLALTAIVATLFASLSAHNRVPAAPAPALAVPAPAPAAAAAEAAAEGVVIRVTEPIVIRAGVPGHR